MTGSEFILMSQSTASRINRPIHPSKSLDRSQRTPGSALRHNTASKNQSTTALASSKNLDLTSIGYNFPHSLKDYVIENPLYSKAENRLVEAGITWAEFLTKKVGNGRAQVQGLDPTAYKHLRTCSPVVTANLTAGLPKGDKAFCAWAIDTSVSGGQAKVLPSSATGVSSYGSLTPQQIKRFDSLRCNLLAKNVDPGCDEVSSSISHC